MDFPSFNLVRLHKNIQSGFTLIEILVVLFIIGIALGAVGISIGAATKEARILNEATRLVDWFNQLRNISIISNKTFKLTIDEPRLVIAHDYYKQDEWVESTIVDKSRFVISNVIETEWVFSDDDVSELFIYPDSTYTSFELELTLSGEDPQVIIGQGVTPPELFSAESDP